MRAVARAEVRRAELQDAGIVHSLPAEQGLPADAEAAMIEHAMLPSVFFPFPGLVSNESVFERVISG